MTITIDAELVALIVVGFVAGTAAAVLFEGRSARANWIRNGIIGMIGAFLGKVIFDALDITDDIPEILTGTITVAEIIIAIVGAAILLFVARMVIR
jgi:uncharacterized membrane protein YeaQ/YmgE (transglycosylase-associated protein family)